MGSGRNGFSLMSDEMRARYSVIMEDYPRPEINPQRIPEDLRDLIPLAEVFGIADDLLREQLVQATPPDVLEKLKSVIQSHEDALDEWLAGPESYEDEPSEEYVAFSAMRFAVDFA